MKLLFDAATIEGLSNRFYQIYIIIENAYFAEVQGKVGIGWHFHRVQGEWIAVERIKQRQADQLGEKIDQRGL